MRDPAQRIADLEEENRRLRVTNGVLMDQAESGLAGGESSYGLFQTAVILEDTVRARTEELSEANRRLHMEISRRREVENALLEAKTAAELANENKTKFLTAVSHDLQQPLTAARLMLQTLAERLGEASHVDMVDRIQQNVDMVDRIQQNVDMVDRTNQTLLTMESLLRSLIDISRLEAGITETRVRDFAVAPLLDQLAAEYGLTAQSRRLEFRAVGSRALVRTDPVLLERVLRNLLTNAVRYTPRGRVLLGLRRAGGAVRIEVWDTGVGIPSDGLTEIFREFRQLPQRATVSEKGLGLGLAIVERICGLLDLPVTVKSVVGRGSMFGVTVPRAPAATGQARVAARRHAEGAATGLLKGRKVAIIENDPTVLSAMATLLETWGVDAIGERSATRLLIRLRRRGTTPDAVISDYHLDGETGEQALARIEDFFGRSLPALIVTGAASEELAARLQTQGRRILTKPINPARLRAVLQRLVVQSRG